MATMTIVCYEFQKRKNSTLTPEVAGISGEEFPVLLKHPTSYRTPIFLLERYNGFSYNYVEWEGWFYYIEDVISVGNGRYEIRCAMDVLATLRGWILNTNAFVMYDVTANTEIVDTRLSMVTSKTTAVNSGAFQALGGHSFPGGTIVAGIITQNGASFYQMDGSTADSLLDTINSDEIPDRLPIPEIEWDEPLEGIANVLNTIGENIVISLRHILGSRSAADCIISAKQLPVLPGAISGTSETIYLGTWNSGKSGKRITNRIVNDTASVAIPWQFSDWRRNAPYTELYLYIPFTGFIQLSVGDLIGESTITIDASLDVITGDLIIEVSTGSGKYIGQYGGNVAGAYAIGSSAVSVGNQVVTAIGATAAGAAAIATGGTAAALAAKIGAAGIFGVIASNTPTPSTIAGGGGGASMGLSATCYCISICHNTNVTPESVGAVVGTPTMAVKRLGDLAGYVQTRCAEVAAPFYGGILDECNALLDGGVYIE